MPDGFLNVGPEAGMKFQTPDPIPVRLSRLNEASKVSAPVRGSGQMPKQRFKRSSGLLGAKRYGLAGAETR